MADSGSWITVAGLLVALAVASGAGLLLWRDGRRRRAMRLRERFGPEYDVAVEQYGESGALRELEARETRVSELPLRSLPPAERASLSQSWLLVQQQLEGVPRQAVRAARELLRRTLEARGYQAQDFDQCIADLSVDYGGIVDHFRAVHALEQADRAGRADDDDLRLALLHYRALLEGLLGTPREMTPPASQRYQPVLDDFARHDHHHVTSSR